MPPSASKRKTTKKVVKAKASRRTAKPKEPKKKQMVAEIPPVIGSLIYVTVQGLSPLVHNTMSKKTIDTLKEKHIQTGGGMTKKKQPRVPRQEFLDSLHTIKKGKTKGNHEDGSLVTVSGIYGAKPEWFKHAMVSATSLLDKMKTRFTRAGVWVLPGDNAAQLLPIVDAKGKPMQADFHEGWVRTAGRPPIAMVRWRGQFKPGWRVEIPILIVDTSMVDPADIPNLLDHAGQKCGVGEGRPSKTPALGWGLFKVTKVRNATKAELKKAGLLV